jgi:hypothetical protein
MRLDALNSCWANRREQNSACARKISLVPRSSECSLSHAHHYRSNGFAGHLCPRAATSAEPGGDGPVTIDNALTIPGALTFV